MVRLWHSAQIDLQWEDLRAPRLEHHRCPHFHAQRQWSRGSTTLLARIVKCCTPMSCYRWHDMFQWFLRACLRERRCWLQPRRIFKWLLHQSESTCVKVFPIFNVKMQAESTALLSYVTGMRRWHPREIVRQFYAVRWHGNVPRKCRARDEGTDGVGSIHDGDLSSCSTRLNVVVTDSFSWCGSRRAGTVFPALTLSTTMLACELTICMEIDQSLRFTRSCEIVTIWIGVFPQHIYDSAFNLLATALTLYHITAKKKTMLTRRLSANWVRHEEHLAEGTPTSRWLRKLKEELDGCEGGYNCGCTETSQPTWQDCGSEGCWHR